MEIYQLCFDESFDESKRLKESEVQPARIWFAPDIDILYMGDDRTNERWISLLMNDLGLVKNLAVSWRGMWNTTDGSQADAFCKKFNAICRFMIAVPTRSVEEFMEGWIKNGRLVWNTAAYDPHLEDSPWPGSLVWGIDLVASFELSDKPQTKLISEEGFDDTTEAMSTHTGKEWITAFISPRPAADSLYYPSKAKAQLYCGGEDLQLVLCHLTR
ncbi:hypothetical protein DL95DRAFT_410487 [Leptodontidium sp. 2 PMI_412]|nr:hypothetical protein DL95DRAFT_410487 [Leptodontidium sp. 2 PMI_412]